MKFEKEAVLGLLKSEKIDFTCIEHAPVYTMEQAWELHLPDPECEAKNLFVRDRKKRQYFLLTVTGNRAVDLKALAARLGTKPLGLASEADLAAILGLFPGAVTPFGLLNDAEHRAALLLDADFRGRTISIHPNDNAATVYLAADDLLALLRRQGCGADYFSF